MVTLSPNQGEVKMDIPSEIIEAVRETKADLVVKPKRKARKPSPLTNRILKAIGNGLRTTASISHELGVTKEKVLSNMGHLKASGRVISLKKPYSTEHKYFLTGESVSVDAGVITAPRKVKAKKVITRKPKVEIVKDETVTKLQEVSNRLAEMQSKLAYLEQALAEKEKEVWTLECEVFDKKAIITYLESKLVVAKGVNL